MNILDKIIYHWHFPRLNIIKTVIFNFKTLPFKVAIKLPVYLYGKVDFYFLLGKVKITDVPIRKGLIKLGMNKEFLGTSKGASLVILGRNSTLHFKGSCEISSNFLLRLGDMSTLTIGDGCFFGNSVKVICINQISIGKWTRIAFESQLIDSDFHYTFNIDQQVVKPREKKIIIGDYNWIGNRTTISKGTYTKPFTIVAASAILNKNYSSIDEQFPVLAGQPAKLVAKNIRRIYDLSIEGSLVDHFKKLEDELNSEMIEEINSSFAKLI